MKQIIYSGLNSKCFILTASMVEDHPFDRQNARQVMKWFVSQTLGNFMSTRSELYETIENNLIITPVESRPITFDGQDYFLNTSLVVYKLPDRTSRDVAQLLGNRSFRDKKFPLTDAVRMPRVGIFKAITGEGYYTSKLMVREDIRNGNDWDNYFCHCATLDNKFNHKVLGISTDAAGYHKYNGLNSYYYGALPQFQIEVAIYDNDAAAINDEDNYWIRTAHLSTINQDYGAAYGLGKTKFHAFTLGGALFISDNVNGAQSIRTKLMDNQHYFEQFDIITINQYSLGNRNNGNIIMGSSANGINHSTPRVRALNMLLMNRDKIKEIRPNNRSHTLDASIVYTKSKMQHIAYRLHVERFFENLYGIGEGYTYIIPFAKDEDIHLKAVDLLGEFAYADTNAKVDFLKDKYFFQLLVKDDGTQGPDVLMEWFKRCSATAKSDAEQLREAYNNLKAGLVKEYQDIEKYLAANNFSDKKPVPAIKLEEEFERSPLKKVSFDFGSETITSINYTQLDKPVSTKFMLMNYMIPWVDRRGVKGYVKGNTLLSKYYDKASNCIVLNSDKIVAEHLERRARR